MTNIYSKLSITHNTLAGGTDSDSVLFFFSRAALDGHEASETFAYTC